MSKQNELAQLADAVTVDGNGNVLIGTDAGDSFNSDSRLRIGNSGDRAFLQFKTDTSNDSGILFGTETDDVRHQILHNPTDDALIFKGNSAETIRLDNDGLKFNGDTAAANALNDYEEGTFTPVVEAYAGTDPTVGYTSRSGSYTKIGNLVFVNIIIALSSYSGGTSNILMISGFPFPIGPSATGTLNSRYTNFVRTTSHSAPVQKLTDYGVGFLTCNNNTNWAWEYTNILQASSSMNITYQYETTA